MWKNLILPINIWIITLFKILTVDNGKVRKFFVNLIFDLTIERESLLIVLFKLRLIINIISNHKIIDNVKNHASILN